METKKISEREERIKKLKELEKLNINPYPAKAHRTHDIGLVLAEFEGLEGDKAEVSIAGRLRSSRGHGNLTFAHLEDASGKIQIAISKKEVGAKSYKIFTDFIDTGDFIEARGACFKTHKGEKSLMVNDWRILSKALRPLPDKWYGFKDEEERFRKRYLDILFNPEVREMIEKKAVFWNAVREFHIKNGFLEVETPVLENTTGGADAKPFVTHHNALDVNVYLRISAGELWQKRLMIAGFEKIFEIGRIFRNEGISSEHLQDYTQCEAYWAYGNYENIYKFLRDCYKYVAEKTFGTLKFKIRGFNVDLNGDWPLIDYAEEIKKQVDINIWKDSDKQIKKKLHELKIESEADNRERRIDALWKYCRKKIGGPAIVINEPKITSPLAKSSPKNPEVTERFHFVIAGSELGQGYSELNEPFDQKERFEAQQKLRDAGDEEAQMFDDEFIEALEYGMPPTCGHGFSERLFSFLMDKPVRECQIFPLMKSKKFEEVKKSPKIKSKSDDINLGINKKQADKLIDQYATDPITKMHSLESEAIMKALARHFGENEEKWGIIGLLHDIDWDMTKNDTNNHGIKAIKLLKHAGASGFLIKTIVSHIYGEKSHDLYKNEKREGRIEYALAASETLTGLIIATVLMQPDKKLSSLSSESLMKKFKNLKFAARCNREIIKECENIGIGLEKFLEIGLKALQEIAGKLGF